VHNPDAGTFQGRCRSWTCRPDDGQRIRDRVSWAVAKNVVNLKMYYFWTLTLADSGWIDCSNCESAKVASEAWNRFATAVRKKYPWFKFIDVREYTEKGVQHRHFLTNVYLDEAWVKDEWARASGGSYVAWVEWIATREGAARYVAKYLTLTSKVAGRKGLYPKKMRRYSTSRSIHLLPRDERQWTLHCKALLRRKLSGRGIDNMQEWFLKKIRDGSANMFDHRESAPLLVADAIDQDSEIENGENEFTFRAWIDVANRRSVLA
jgi:hypothetical protein